MILIGRKICGGQSQGEVLSSKEPISFLGGVDRETGVIIDKRSDAFGKSLEGKIFVFPTGKGSTAGSYVLYGLKLKGKAPIGIVTKKAETIVAVGAIISSIPMIDGIDTDLLLDGDKVFLDANNASLEIRNVQLKPVTTSFLENQGSILILRRSEKVSTYKGKWAGISGYLETGEKAEERAKAEVEEETGVKDVYLARRGEVVLARDSDVIWQVHPFLFSIKERKVELGWEHSEYRWIKKEDLEKFDTVPRLKEALDSSVGKVGPSS